MALDKGNKSKPLKKLESHLAKAKTKHTNTFMLFIKLMENQEMQQTSADSSTTNAED